LNEVARQWFLKNTSGHWSLDASDLVELKLAAGARVSVVVPARNEAATIGSLLGELRGRLVEDVPLVDELVVMDSLSVDATAEIARAAGARVCSVSETRPELGVHAGKGEALWKSQFVTSGDLVVFIDADLVGWGPHFVSGLLGPLLADPAIVLVKGFYDRELDDGSGAAGPQGGRVTELVARPLLANLWPDLAAVVQPLAGEWAIRRDWFATLSVPEGYGVEMSTLLDTWLRRGPAGIAQVDLGHRAHRHQSVHDLGVMAAEILQVTLARKGWLPKAGAAGRSVTLDQFDRVAPDNWTSRRVPVGERPPLIELGNQVARINDDRPRSAGPVGGLARAPDPIGGMDRRRAEESVRQFLIAVGEDPDREGLRDTPARVARACAEMFAGLFSDPGDVLETTFDEDHDELVLVKDIPVYSMCEHHLLPWHGTAAVGYIPGPSGRLTGLSKLARVVDLFAKRPQLQERLTSQIADAVQQRLEPAGAIVVVQAEHLCMAMRGIRKPGSMTLTSAVRGIFKTDGRSRAEAMSLILAQ
jgi:glucosyl-3-phosphoglycerate synthase